MRELYRLQKASMIAIKKESNMKSKFTNFFKVTEKKVSPKILERARNAAKREIFRIRLAELRNKYKIKQVDFKKFKQASISRIENRADIRISTLVGYLHDIDMELTISAKPRKHKAKKGFVLLQG
jgi:hypothetical protein